MRFIINYIKKIFKKNECNHKYMYHVNGNNNYFRVCKKCYFISYYTKLDLGYKKPEYVWMKMTQYTENGAKLLLNELSEKEKREI